MDLLKQTRITDTMLGVVSYFWLLLLIFLKVLMCDGSYL